MAEIFKIEKGVLSYILNEFSKFTEIPRYNLRTGETLKREMQKQLFPAQNLFLLVIKVKLWELVPIELKNIESIDNFKRKINRVPVKCPCRFSKSYL